MNPQSQAMQIQLAKYYRSILCDPADLIRQDKQLWSAIKRARNIEDRWNAHEEFASNLITLPETSDDFLAWYLAYEKKMNTDIQPFIDYLQSEATATQVAYYVCMEEMVDGSFDDLLSLVQLGMLPMCKMVVAENYWDEMGNGNSSFVHTTMFRTSSAYLRALLDKENVLVETPPAECLMNGNILLMWALRREYNIRLIGAMGLVEGSAPIRFSATTNAMTRLNMPKEVIAYHEAHIGIDTTHSRAWYDTILHTYSRRGPNVIKELSLGVLIRYNIAIQYYQKINTEMRKIK